MCTKSIELFELCSKEKAIFLHKLHFIKVRCLINVNKFFSGLLRNEYRTIYDTS